MTIDSNIIKAQLEEYVVLLAQKKAIEKKLNKCQRDLSIVEENMRKIEWWAAALPQGVTVHQGIAVIRAGSSTVFKNVNPIN